MQTAYLGPDEVCITGPLKWQPSTVAWAAMPAWGPSQTPYWAQQVQSKATNTRPQWRIPGLKSSAQYLSPITSFTSAKEKSTTR